MHKSLATLQILIKSYLDSFKENISYEFTNSAAYLYYHAADYSPLGSSVHGILQARILEWVAVPSSRGSSQPRDQIQVSCIAGGSLPTESPGKPHISVDQLLNCYTSVNKTIIARK